jgi:hemerythrin
MNKHDWNESFSVGQKKIDEQHRTLMQLLSKLSEHLPVSYVSNDDLQLLNLLGIIYEYALKHFAYEELYMRDIRYPRIDQHAAIHEDITNQINHYYVDITEGKIILDTQIIEKFNKMLRDHILNEDMQYSLFAKEHKI